ncbi:hypothetical protein Tco_0314074 [Tanacetum coccineum]
MKSCSSSSRSIRYSPQDVENLTHCDCKPPHAIYEQIVWTLKNPQRIFKGCPVRDKTKECNVYGFLDVELPSQYYKELLFNLYHENKQLKGILKKSDQVRASNHHGHVEDQVKS